MRVGGNLSPRLNGDAIAGCRKSGNMLRALSMTFKSRWPLVILIWLVALSQARAQSINELQRGFERPPGDAKIMMRSWWFGPAVTKPELAREMRLMKAGGIGGFEVQPVYPLS